MAPIKTDSEVRLEAGDDLSFRPDRGLRDGDLITGPGWTLEAIETPGHTSGHMCYALREENALFSGDHVMGWSTTVISPPDGDMQAYLHSLERISERGFETVWPTHGPPIREPNPFLDAYRAHRLHREQQILRHLEAGPCSIKEMVPVLYASVDPKLWPAACHSVLAHMIRLEQLGQVQGQGEAGVKTIYERVAS